MTHRFKFAAALSEQAKRDPQSKIMEQVTFGQLSIEDGLEQLTNHLVETGDHIPVNLQILIRSAILKIRLENRS